jgi:TfoX/Sxy family transcriptional regulator of competence genes
MAFEEKLASRVRAATKLMGQLAEKKMFGGLCFLHEGKMCCGILGEDLVIRVDPSVANELLKRKGFRPMDFTGRPMRGYLYVAPTAIQSDVELFGYLGHAIDFVRSLARDHPKNVKGKQRPGL